MRWWAEFYRSIYLENLETVFCHSLFGGLKRGETVFCRILDGGSVTGFASHKRTTTLWGILCPMTLKKWNEHMDYPFGREQFKKHQFRALSVYSLYFVASIAGVYTVGCLPWVRLVNLLWFYRDSFVEVCESTFLPRKNPFEKLL